MTRSKAMKIEPSAIAVRYFVEDYSDDNEGGE